MILITRRPLVTAAAVRTAPIVAALLIAACGSSADRASRPLPPDYVPVTVGASAQYRPRAASPQVRAARPVDGERCSPRPGVRYGAHLEMFVSGHVVAIPTAIGIAPPVRVDAAARVTAGRCFYPAITTDPTGVIELTRGPAHTLGELFAIWGEPLGPRRVLGFMIPPGERLMTYVGTRRWSGRPGAIPLRRHTRVVIELASHIPPHRAYAFPPGL